jgi:hypothetical protein
MSRHVASGRQPLPAAAIRQHACHADDHRRDQDDKPGNNDHDALQRSEWLGMEDQSRATCAPSQVRTKIPVLLPRPQLYRGRACRGPGRHSYLTLPATFAGGATLPETDKINLDIRKVLDVSTVAWRVEVTLVELKDIQLPAR